MVGSTNNFAISTQELSTEDALRGLSAAHKKDKVMSTLCAIENSGPATAEALNVGDRVCRLMGHQDPEVAAKAVVCIGLMGRKAVKYSDYLVAGLQHPQAAIRAACVEAIGRLSAYLKFDDVSKIALTQSDDEAIVRIKLCNAIAEMEDSSMHEVIGKLLKDASLSVQAAAMEALGALISYSLEVHSIYAGKIGGIIDTMLGKEATQSAALKAISKMGDQAPSSCAVGVIGSLSSQDCVVREAAVTAVGSMVEAVLASESAVEKIKELLGHDSPGVKAAAATALGVAGNKAASCADAVAQLLRDTSEDSSGLALVIGNGARRTLPVMRRPQCAALTALGRMEAETYIPEIAKALSDPNWEVRLSAAEALAELKEKAKSESKLLTDCLEDDAYPVRAMVCFALGQLKDPETLSRLVDTFEDSAGTVRKYAVEAVGEMGDAADEHCHDVFKLTFDPLSPVKAAAVRVLGLLGSTGEHYASVISTMLIDNDAEVTCAILEALGNMGAPGKACAPEVEQCLESMDPFVRAAAVSSLESMGILMSPFLQDFSRGLDKASDVVTLLPGEANFAGIGAHRGNILERKAELQAAGKWVSGVF